MAKSTPVHLIHNKFVLYFVFFIALLNLFFSAVKGDYLFCALFILIGFITAFFNKNMTVILVLTTAVSNILRVLIRGGHTFEGMEGSESGSGSGSGSLAKEPAGSLAKEPEPEPEEKPEPTTKKKKLDELKTEAISLLETQEAILEKFSEIDPQMKKAEGLINRIEGMAKDIQKLNGSA
jgi:hypothetical protein